VHQEVHWSHEGSPSHRILSSDWYSIPFPSLFAIDLNATSGHLLLSASLDGKCKIWDVYGDRNVKRTYIGHEESIKSIHMTNDGASFLSSAYDRYIRYAPLPYPPSSLPPSSRTIVSGMLKVVKRSQLSVTARWATKSNSIPWTTTSFSWQLLITKFIR
jgi:WD40 repeat protein